MDLQLKAKREEIFNKIWFLFHFILKSWLNQKIKSPISKHSNDFEIAAVSNSRNRDHGWETQQAGSNGVGAIVWENDALRLFA